MPKPKLIDQEIYNILVSINQEICDYLYDPVNLENDNVPIYRGTLDSWKSQLNDVIDVIENARTKTE